MSLEDKIAQLTQVADFGNTDPNNFEGEDSKKGLGKAVGSVIVFKPDAQRANDLQKKALETGLGIPILFGADIIHGAHTVYPTPLALASSFDFKTVSDLCSIAARESRLGGVRWTFAPMIDVSRDPRWGRIVESAGEDVLLNQELARASVTGFQGASLKADTSVLACLKHFVGYGASEAGRDYAYTEISDQSMEEVYLPPYESGVKAGALTVMSAFNDINGIPASANPHLLTDVLRTRWKFPGFVVTDWSATDQLVDQRFAEDGVHACAASLNAGVDLNMVDHSYWNNLKKCLAQNLTTQKIIDQAVSRVLNLKFKIGLFEHPFTPTTQITDEQHKQDRALARRAAESSFVLLKNNGALPLAKGASVALIGPMAEEKNQLLGNWKAWGQAKDVVSIREGMSRVLTEERIHFNRGCSIEGGDIDTAGISQAIASSDIVVACVGESAYMSGENGSRAEIRLPVKQEELVRIALNSGKPVILLISSGRPIILGDLSQRCAAIMEVWQPGVEAGNAIARVVTGAVSPSGKLTVTWPKSVGQIPLYYCKRLGGRPDLGRYQDAPCDPEFPFGHGLSYTSFKYSVVSLSNPKCSSSGESIATVDVTNTGKVDADEVVLWYVSQKSGLISRPNQLLKHFERKAIPAGATVRFTWTIRPRKDLSYPLAGGKSQLDMTDYIVRVGKEGGTTLSLLSR